jgi:hypothetical protein
MRTDAVAQQHDRRARDVLLRISYPLAPADLAPSAAFLRIRPVAKDAEFDDEDRALLGE